MNSKEKYHIETCLDRIDVNHQIRGDLPGNGRHILNRLFDRIFVVNLKHEAGKRIASRIQLDAHGIDYEFIEAINGYREPVYGRFLQYTSNPIGQLKRYAEYNERELKNGSHFIDSPGAYGYIETYLSILKRAKAEKLNRILIFEDDVLFCNGFEPCLMRFVESIPQNWKILQLGASQYKWEEVDIQKALADGHYYPRILHTCGSFAMAVDSSVFDELIEAQSAFESTFDLLALGEIYERHLGQCFVAYPNVVIPDVSTSSIRHSRDQISHSARMRWPLQNYQYPRLKPTVSILLTSDFNVKYLRKWIDRADQAAHYNFYRQSGDGLRPVHAGDLDDNTLRFSPAGQADPVCPDILPAGDLCIVADPYDALTEESITHLLESHIVSVGSNATRPIGYVPGLASVIIPTYKRATHLFAAIRSVAEQDYPMKEVIVISDNGEHSEYEIETCQMIAEAREAFPSLDIRFVSHTTNRNSSAAKNTGILQSNGEFISFLDDDDVYLPGRLTNCIRVLRSHSYAGAAYCGFIGRDSTGNDLNRYPEGDLTRQLLTIDSKSHYLHANTVTYKRSAVFAINGFDESFNRQQDIEFNLRFFTKFRIVAHRECLVRLEPEPTDVDNRVLPTTALDLELKFVGRFEELIHAHGNKFAKEVYHKHLAETYRLVRAANQSQSQFESGTKSFSLDESGPKSFSLELVSNLASHADLAKAEEELNPRVELNPPVPVSNSDNSNWLRSWFSKVRAMGRQRRRARREKRRARRLAGS